MDREPNSVFRVISNERIHLAILALVWLAVHTFLFMHYGIRNFADASIYIRVADQLATSHSLEEARYIFYIVPISILTVFRWILPDSILPFIIFQCIVSGFAVMALYKTATRVFNNSLAGFFASILFLLWVDNLHWNLTIMTESLMCSIACFILYIVTCFTNTVKDYIKLILLSILILLTRPTGFIICIGIMAFIIFYHWNYIRKKAVLKYAIFTTLLIAAFLFMYMLTMWNFIDQNRRGNIITYADLIRDSTIRHSINITPDQPVIPDEIETLPTKTIYFISHNFFYFIKTGLLKIYYLLSGVRPYYSWWHNLFTLLWMSIIYVLSFLGWRTTSSSSIKIFIGLVLIANCFLTGLTTVDWDNRFYIPMEPGVVMLAAGGLLKFFERSTLNKQNQSETRKASHSLV